MGTLPISRRLWRITMGLSLPELLSEMCTAACLFTPLVLESFGLLALVPSSVGPLGGTVSCIVDLAALALARASAALLNTNYYAHTHGWWTMTLSCPTIAGIYPPIYHGA